MSKKVIKGLTVKIGGDTTELGKALEGVEKKGRDISGELTQINKLLKMDPSNTELLAQKQSVLAEAIANAKEKLETLKEAEKQVQEQFERGEASEAQVRALQREIVATTQKLQGYEKAAQEAADATEDAGNEASDAAADTDKYSDATDKAKKSNDSLSDSLNKGVAVGFAAVTAAVGAAIGALASSVESTHEYRTEMGKLTTAFDDNNHSAEAAYKTYADLQSVVGETDQAVEAANHLALLTDNEQELETWTNILTGAYAKMGASLPIENLAEAANETSRTGTLTGGLTDAINWASEAGVDFGVTLKENISFTKLSAKELQKMTNAQRAEYEARQKQYEEIEAYNKSVAEATSAEEKFQIALDNCTTEQERQQLIMDTLNGIYSDAADAYKETNAEVIRSNQATEKLNKMWAAVGAKATPIVNTFREEVAELGASMADMVTDADVEEWQRDIQLGFRKLSTDVVPKLIKALKWCIDNFNIIKSAAGGFIAALAVGKIATFATSVGTTMVNAYKTLTTSIKGATTAQQGMNAAASSNVYVLLAQVVIGVATALGTYFTSRAEEAKDSAAQLAQEMYGLSDAEQAAADNANEAADAFKNMRSSVDENTGAITSQYGYIASLKNELLNLVNAEGEVDEKNKSRAEFILNELNEALDTEYTMTGNLVNNYKDLAESIDLVIEKKKAELLLNANQEAYAAALQGKAQADSDYYTNLMAYMTAQANLRQAYVEEEELRSQYLADLDAGGVIYAWFNSGQRLQAKEAEVEELNKIFKETEEAYKNNKVVLQGYYEDIGQYETAQMLTLEGNTAEAVKVLSDREYYLKKYADSVGFASDEVQTTWEMEAIEAGIKAAEIRKNWENGVAGYTEGMVNEAEENYQAALDAMGTAYEDAEAVGGDLTNGIGAGLECGRWSLIDKAKSIVKNIISAFRDEADCHSPSRKMVDFGEDMGEGGVVGLENQTVPFQKAAQDQVRAVMDTYKNTAQHEWAVLERLTNRPSSPQLATMEASADLMGTLDAILQAIKDGRVMMIDGDTLLGFTDNGLGQRRALAARGAL